MHYCFITSGSWDGNASFVRLREFGNELSARGHQVSCIADDVPYNVEKLPGLFNSRAAIHFTTPSTGVRQFRARRKILKQIHADYVHVLNPSVKAFLALFFSNYKIIGDWDEWPAHRDFGFARRIRERFLDHWLRSRSHRPIVASRYLQGQFKDRFGLDAAYIPYAAYLQHHADGNSPFAEPAAVYMGNFYPAYDHDLLFEAARILKSRGRTPRLVLLGTGPDLEKWRAFVKDNGLTNVDLPGFVSGELLWRNLRHAQVLLFPIRQTLLNRCRCPSKTFAYAQSRRPIITSRVGEVAAVLGDRARYVLPTPVAFADAIEQAMAEPTPLEIDYHIEQQNWRARTDALLQSIGEG